VVSVSVIPPKGNELLQAGSRDEMLRRPDAQREALMQVFWPGRSCTLFGNGTASTYDAAQSLACSRPAGQHGASAAPFAQQQSGPSNPCNPPSSRPTQTALRRLSRGIDPILSSQTIWDVDRGWSRGYICAGLKHKQNSEPGPRNQSEGGNTVFVSVADQVPGIAGTGN